MSGTASADMTFDLGDAGGAALTGPDTHGLIRYVLLRRAGDTGDFEVVKTADSIPDDQIVFNNVSPGDSYHTLGLRPDSAPNVANALSDITVNEDAGPTTINIAGVFADIDNDDTAILESVVSDSNPSLISVAVSENTLTLTFGADRNGTADVVIRGTSDGKTADDSFTVTVNPVDDPLYLAIPLPDVTADEDAADTTINLGSLFADIDSSVIVKSVLSNSSPSLMSASITGDTLTLDYLENQHGAAEIVIRGTADSATADDSFTVTVNPVDDAPSVAGEIEDVTADEDAPPVTVNLDSVFTDVDNDDTAIVKTVLSDDNPSPVSATVAGDTLTLEFQENQNGTATITVQASSGGRITEDTFTVTVNPVDDPLTVISEIPDVAADEDAVSGTINLGGVFGDIDSDISAITKTLLSNDSPSLVSATVTGDILTLEYQADQSGTATIIVQGDSEGQTAEDTFTVTVSPVDDPPVVENEMADVTADEDAEDALTDLAGVFSDIDNDDGSILISVQSVSTPSLIAATVVGNTLTLEYQENQNGTATVIILAESGEETVTDEFVVTVNPVDDPPVISAAEDQITDRNDTAGPVRFTVSDPDGDVLTVSAGSSDTGLVPDENIVLAGAGEERSVTVTPGPDAHGEAVIILTVSDGVLTAEAFVLTVRNVYKISGQVTYFAGENPPIPDVLVSLESDDGSFSAEALTDENGRYILSGIPPGISYTSALSKTGDPGPGGISAEDVSKIARSVIGATEIDGHQRGAADVNGNGKISSVDASDLARYRTGLIQSLSDSGNNWAFEPVSARYPDLNSDPENQDFAAMRLGDLSGNWTPEQSRKSVRTPQQTSEISKTSEIFITAARGGSLSVPVILNGGTETEGLDIAVGYDRNMLEVTDVTLAGGMLEHEGYRLVANTGDGHIRIAVFAVSENLFTGDGAILFISFNVIGTGPGSVLEITEFQCNEMPVSDEYGRIRETGSLSGGFYTDGIVSQHLGIRFRTEYDPDMHDLDGDGRIGLEDAVRALQKGYPEGAIRALQSASGIK